jgi:hypothetical protein
MKNKILGIFISTALLLAIVPLALSVGAPAPVVKEDNPIGEAFGTLAQELVNEETKKDYAFPDGKLGFGLDDGYAIYGILLSPGGKCVMPNRTFRRTDPWKLAFAVNKAAAGDKVKFVISRADGSGSEWNPAMVSPSGTNRGGVSQDDTNVGAFRLTITNTTKQPCFVAMAYLREKPPVRVSANGINLALKNMDAKQGFDDLIPAMNTPIIHGLALAPKSSWDINPVGFPPDSQFAITSDNPANTTTMTITNATKAVLMSASSSMSQPAKITGGVVKGGRLNVANQGAKPTIALWAVARPATK